VPDRPVDRQIEGRRRVAIEAEIRAVARCAAELFAYAGGRAAYRAGSAVEVRGAPRARRARTGFLAIGVDRITTGGGV